MRFATAASVVLLLLIAALHVLRLLYRVEVVAGDMVIPLWASALGAGIPAALAVGILREHRAPSPRV